MMKNLIFITIFIAVLLPSMCGVTFEGVLKNFSIPLLNEEQKENGSVKGKEAKFLDENRIEIVEADSWFRPEGSLRVWELKTHHCILNKKTGYVDGEAPVEIKTDGIVIDGEGLHWNIKDKGLMIYKNVTVDFFKNDFKKGT